MEACGRNPDDLSSMLVVESSRKLYLKSDAALRIAEVGYIIMIMTMMMSARGALIVCNILPSFSLQVAAPHPLLGPALEKAASLLLPQGVRDGAYDVVATNRYSILGKREVCRVPDPNDDRFLA